MKISYKWLKEYINVDLSVNEIEKYLTSIGLEVETIEKYESIPGGLKNFIIGKIVSCIKHPAADKLWLTEVNIGEKVLKIVCGAPNVKSGQNVVVALPGAKVNTSKGSIVIEKTKIRGEDSEGMICAEDELGIGNSHDGILVLPDDIKPGTLASEFFNVYEDYIFEIGLTPNRIDAASHLGIARELAAVLNSRTNANVKVNFPNVDFSPDTNDFNFNIIIENSKLCRRYAGLLITNVKVDESPQWLKNKLKAIGLNPINNIVDITNFVMYECGQPLHAFDADKIKGNKVIIKTTVEGTEFITLDGKTRKLTSEDLMICNSEEPMCIAGVFGGLHSGITQNTKNIFLESANFNPVSIRKTSRYHDLKTDSSFRFERGIDPEGVIFAIKRAGLLIKEIAGGKISIVKDIYPDKISKNIINISISRINKFIGHELSQQKIIDILKNLEFNILSEKFDEITVEVPSYRTDVTRECDVIEEILRIYGYDNIPIPEKYYTSFITFPKINSEKFQNVISDYLVSNGFYEIWNNSLISSSFVEFEKFDENIDSVKILNPLSSELSTMRPTLLYSGLQTIAYNINRKTDSLRLFEFGKIYFVNKNTHQNINNFLEKYIEKNALGIFLTGKIFQRNWYIKDRNFDFYDIKKYVEQIIHIATIEDIKISLNDNDDDKRFKHKFSIHVNNKEIAYLGTVSDDLLKLFDISQTVLYAEIDWDKFIEFSANKKISFTDIPKYPHVERDIAIILDENITFEDVKKLILNTDTKLIRHVSIFDVYKGEKLLQGKKSYAVSLIIQDNEKTLTDEEINTLMNKVMKNIINTFKAEIPGYKPEV